MNAPVVRPDELRELEDLLAKESGFYFDQQRRQALDLIVRDRLTQREDPSFEAYFRHIRVHPQGYLELREIVDRLTVGETHFFRNRPHFDALMKHILPTLLAERQADGTRRLRVWSAGCSRGAEAYSVAIALLEVLPSLEGWDLAILGTDINRQALKQAKEAAFSGRDLTYLPQEYLTKYFKLQGSRYVLREPARRLVSFLYHNLVKDPYLADGMSRVDVLLCRNVTIYFDPATTKQVVERFYDCLSDRGYLLIGHAETLWQVTDRFRLVEFPRTFAYQKSVEPAASAHKPFVAVPEVNVESAPNAAALPSAAEGEPPAKDPVIEDLYGEAIRLVRGKHYPTALVCLANILRRQPGHVPARWLKATIFANQAKYREAETELHKVVSADPLHVEAQYLLAVVLYKSGQLERAERQFQTVLYLSPTLALAHFQLGNLYYGLARWRQADWQFGQVERLLAGQPGERTVAFCEEFTVELLLKACQHFRTRIAEQRLPSG